MTKRKYIIQIDRFYASPRDTAPGTQKDTHKMGSKHLTVNTKLLSFTIEPILNAWDDIGFPRNRSPIIILSEPFFPIGNAHVSIYVLHMNYY